MKLLRMLASTAESLIGRSVRYGSPENPSVDLYSSSAWDMFGGGSSASSGVVVGQKTALTYSPVFRAVSLISSSVAKLPLYVYKQDKDGSRMRAPEHFAYPLLRRKPNSEMNAFTFKETLQAHALTRGNGYAYIFRDTDSGQPIEIIPLNPDATYPIRYNGVLWYVTSVGGEQRKLEPSNVLHIKGMGFDGLIGYDVITYARNSLGLGMAAESYGSRFFKNGTRPSVVIQHPKVLTIEAAQKLSESFGRIYAGIENSHKAAVLEEGATIQPFSFNSADSQLIETREFELRSVANWFGCPPHKLGDTTRTAYASLEQENQAFLDECLDPWLCRWEYECDDKLLSEDEKESESAFTEFNRGALVRADMAQRYAAYSEALGGRPFATQNEVRRKENMPPIEGGDVILEPLNMAKVDPVSGHPGGKPKDTTTGKKSAEPDDADKLPLMRRLLEDAAGRMIRRLGVHVRKAAKEPSSFVASIDSIEAEHRETIVDALDAAVRLVGGTYTPKAAADLLLADLREELLEVSGRFNAANLATGVDAAMGLAEAAWAGKLADKILTAKDA